MKRLLILSTALCGLADLAFAGFLIRLVSAFQFPCATSRGFAVGRVEAAEAVLIILVIAQIVLAHLCRASLAQAIRAFVFLPWALGAAMLVVWRLVL
jgi:hypothetical protein